MKYEFWLAAQIRIPGRKRIQAEKLCGSAEQLFFQSRESLEKMHIFHGGEIEWLCESRLSWDVDGAWEQFLKSGMSFVPYGERAYPERLRHIYQPPYALYYRGCLPDAPKTVGIVGARMCSEYGRSIAGRIAELLGENQVPVISGLALGIDSAAHAGALATGALTFAVLGCGCDICYPKASANLYRNMLQTGGGVVSEYPPGTKPVPYHFPERNRIISALSDILIVVEAKKKSGSLITADCALEQGKDIYAVPGRMDDTLSAGCNRLISQGAGILYNIDSFLEEIGILGKKNKNPVNSEHQSLEKEEMMVYSCVDLHPKFINNIIEETGLNLLEALHILEKLKKRRLIQETFQNYYCRCL